jgi:undecaprenyl-diphosphatase
MQEWEAATDRTAHSRTVGGRNGWRRIQRRAGAWLGRLRALAPTESRVLVVALGIVAGLWIFVVTASLVTAGRTQAFDEHVLRALRRTDDPGLPIGPGWVHAFALDVTALGSVPIITLIVLLVVGHLAIERRHAMVALVLAASCGGGLLNGTLKALFDRARPTVVPPLAIVGSSSFPSGHSMIAAVVYLTLGALLARTTTRWRLRLYYLGVALGITGAIGLSRVYLGVHYPSDVLAGWAAGTVWALVCELVAQRLQREGEVEPPTR